MIITRNQILCLFLITAIFKAFPRIMQWKLLETLQVLFESLAFIFQQILM